MLKLFRCINAEHRKLWSKGSTVFSFVLIAVLSVCAVIFCLLMLSADADRMPVIMDSVQGRVLLEELGKTPEAADGASDSTDYQTEPVVDNYVVLPDGSISFSDAAVSDDAVSGSVSAGVAEINERIREIDIALETSDNVAKPALRREKAMLLREAALLALESGAKTGSAPAWSILVFCLWLITPAVAIATVVMASDMFAGEFERGTVGLMLCRPATRIKQYIAKLFTSLLFLAAIMLTAYFSILLTCALTVSGGVNGMYVGYVDGEAYATTWGQHSIHVLLCCYSAVAVCVFLCAAIGNITRSRAASVGAALGLLGISFYLGDFITSTGIGFFGKSIFACLDLTVPLLYLANEPSVFFSECVVLVGLHALVFIIAGYIAFRRDIE